MDVLTLISEPNFDYSIAYGFYANHSNNQYLIKYLEHDKGVNRKMLKKEIIKLCQSLPNLKLSAKDAERGAVSRSYDQFKKAPEAVQKVVLSKNEAYKMLNERFAMLKGEAFRQLNFKGRGFISLKHALATMNSRDAAGNANVFSIIYVTNNGEIREYSALSLTKLLKNQLPKAIRILNEKNKRTTSGNRYWASNTRRCMILKDKKLLTIRINQIVAFNGMEVSWT